MRASGQRSRSSASAGRVTRKSPSAPPLRTRIRIRRRWRLVVDERGDARAELELDLKLHGQMPFVLRNPDPYGRAALEHALRGGLLHARHEHQCVERAERGADFLVALGMKRELVGL